MLMNKIRMSQACLYSISYQNLTDFYSNQSLQRDSAVVGHNTNLTIEHSRVTVRSCLMEYVYKLLRQFTTTVRETR